MGAPTHSVILDQKLQVFDRRKLASLEDRWLCLRVRDKVFGRNLSNLGIAMVQELHEL